MQKHTSGALLRSYSALTNRPDGLGMQGCSGMQRDATGCHGMQRDATGCHGMQRDAGCRGLDTSKRH